MTQKLLGLICLACSLYAQSITITTPGEGATATGTVTAAAMDASMPSLCSVEWRIDNDASILPARVQSEAAIIRAHPWSYPLKTQALPDGSYTLTAIARDCLGAQLAIDTNSFTIDNNAASVSQTSPTDPAADVTTTVNWTIVASGISTCQLVAFIDGRQISSTDACTKTVSVNPVLYRNGSHVLDMTVVDKTVGSVTHNSNVGFHRWQANFATGSGTAMELRTNALNAVLVAGGATHAITGFLANTDGTTSAATISCVSDLPSIASVSGCVVIPVASGLATITVTDSGSGKTALVYIFVRLSTNTPHFGSDRTMRATYDSSVSRYIRSMFFFEKQYLDADATLRTEANKSGLNMMEGNVYSGQPGNTGQSESAWKTNQDTVTSGLLTTLGTLDSKFRLLCLGDGMFGGSGLADDIGGPAQQTWTTKPVPYMAAWAKGHCVLMEVEDEINAGYGGQPRPRFIIGQDISRVVVVSGMATATLVNRQCGRPPSFNAEIVGGVTSGLNASNKAVSCASQFSMTWTTTAADGEYNFTGTGCTGSPCVAEPNYQVKIFYNLPRYTTSPVTPNVPETGFTDLVALMTDSGTRPNIAWPLISGSTVGSYEAWTKDPTFADYTSMYTSCSTAECTIVHPFGQSIAQTKGVLDLKWRTIFPGIQAEKPMTALAGWAGTSFNRGGQLANITSITGNVVTSVASNAAPSGHARIQGASDNGHNDFFHIGKVFSPTSYEIMNRSPIATLGDCGSPATVTGEGGAWTRTITLMNNNAVAVSVAYPSLRVGEHFTVSGCSQGGYNKEWIYLASGSATSIQYRDYPTVSSTGGTIRISVGSDFDPTYDTPLAAGSNLKSAFVSHVIAWMLPGNSGTRSYGFDRGSAVIRAAAFPYVWAKRSDSSLTNIVVSSGTATVNFAEPHRLVGTLELRIRGVTTAGGTALNVDPVVFANCGSAGSTSCTFSTSASNGTYTDSTMDVRGFLSASEQQTFSDPTRGNSRLAWRAQANAWNLFQRIEPFMLQPILPSPDYGWCLMTAARGPSTYGRALLVLNACEVPITQTIDYSAYVYSGKPISEYRADWTGIRTGQATGTSAEYTIQPGELVALLFHDSESAFVLSSTISLRPTDHSNGSKVALRYAYVYEELLDLNTKSVFCLYGTCFLFLDRQLGDIWFRYEYLDSSNVVQAVSDVEKIPRASP